MAWAVAPYLLAAYVAKFLAQRKLVMTWFFLSIALGVFGLWAYVSALYLSVDAQAVLVIFFAPIWQIGLLFIGSFLLWCVR